MTMKTIDEETFAAICFAVLMEDDDHAPSYVKEKINTTLSSGYNALNLLDKNNQRRVFEWLKKWRVNIPERQEHMNMPSLAEMRNLLETANEKADDNA